MKRELFKAVWLFAVALFCFSGCNRGPVGSRADQEEDIQEAVLLHLIKPRAYSQSSAFFVSINRGDPSPQFLQRLAKHQLNAKPESQSSLVYGGVKDPSTGESSSIFDVGQIKWIDATSVKVDGGYYMGNVGAMSCEYSVTWDGKQWDVEKEAGCVVA